MFVETMSGAEMYAEYHLDVPELNDRTLRFNESKCVQRIYRKNSQREVITLTKTIKSRRGNQYIALMISRKVEGRKERDFSIYHVGLINTNKGLSALVFYDTGTHTIIHTPHFFDRYAERFSKIADWRERDRLRHAKTQQEIIAVYIERNLNMIWFETERMYGDRVHIFAPVADGVVMLQWDKKRKQLQANTFLTPDMLSQRQMNMVDAIISYSSLPDDIKEQLPVPDYSLED